MQQQLINLNPDLKRLDEDGYELEVCGGHLLVHHIPYVCPSRIVKYGTLVCVLNYSSPTIIGRPQDHTIFFTGETPCNADGSPMFAIINNSQTRNLSQDIVVNHYFSSKPTTGNYPNYYEKIRTYGEILSSQAKVIDSSVTVRIKNVVNDENQSRHL
jgi:hypothetical protein